VISLAIQSSNLPIMDLHFHVMLYSNLGKEKSDTGHIKRSRAILNVHAGGIWHAGRKDTKHLSTQQQKIIQSTALLPQTPQCLLHVALLGLVPPSFLTFQCKCLEYLNLKQRHHLYLLCKNHLQKLRTQHL